MAEIKQTERAAKLLVAAMECSRERRHEFIMPEHLLLRLTDDFNFHAALNIFYPPQKLVERLEEQLARVERVPDGIDYQPAPSEQMGRLIEMACRQVVSSSAPAIDLPHLVQAMLQLEDSWACYLLKDCLLDKESNFMSHLIEFCEFDDSLHDQFGPSQQEDAWRQLVSCMNDLYKQHNPLIGREQELQRTIQVLCRRDKNNPLHIGEPGVGKTALVWGLRARAPEAEPHLSARHRHAAGRHAVSRRLREPHQDDHGRHRAGEPLEHRLY